MDAWIICLHKCFTYSSTPVDSTSLTIVKKSICMHALSNECWIHNICPCIMCECHPVTITTHARMHTHIYMHTHAHIHTRTHTHTHSIHALCTSTLLVMACIVICPLFVVPVYYCYKNTFPHWRRIVVDRCTVVLVEILQASFTSKLWSWLLN